MWYAHAQSNPSVLNRCANAATWNRSLCNRIQCLLCSPFDSSCVFQLVLVKKQHMHSVLQAPFVQRTLLLRKSSATQAEERGGAPQLSFWPIDGGSGDFR